MGTATDFSITLISIVLIWTSDEGFDFTILDLLICTISRWRLDSNLYPLLLQICIYLSAVSITPPSKNIQQTRPLVAYPPLSVSVMKTIICYIVHRLSLEWSSSLPSKSNKAYYLTTCAAHYISQYCDLS